MDAQRQSLIDRWFSKVHFTPDCWIWRGCRGPSGHGVMNIAGKTTGAYRVAYELFIGPVPTGLHLDHLCRNTWCVNPRHLEPVTRGENLRRALVARTKCRRGHVYGDWNVGFVTRGNGRVERYCVECHRVAMRRLNAKWNAIYKARGQGAVDRNSSAQI